MIWLMILDIVINRVSIMPSFLFLLGILGSDIRVVILCGVIMDIVFDKGVFNTLVLVGMYIINRRYLKRGKRFRDYYLSNLINLVIYYSVGYLVFSKGLSEYVISLLGIVVFNSLIWVGSYSFRIRS